MVSARDVQRNYRSIFNQAKKSGPVVVMTNNKPDVAIIDAQILDQLYSKIRKLEMVDAMEAIEDYKKEKREGKLIEAKSLRDLINNTEDDED